MIKYQIEKFMTCIAEMQPMLAAQWDEVESNKEEIPLDPDYAQYHKLCDAGIVQLATAREEGKLIGYLLVFVVPHLHHRTVNWASSDIFYITPDKRKGDVAYELIQITEKELKTKDVQILNLNMKAHVPYINLAEKCGYISFELVYAKYIGD